MVVFWSIVDERVDLVLGIVEVRGGRLEVKREVRF